MARKQKGWQHWTETSFTSLSFYKGPSNWVSNIFLTFCVLVLHMCCTAYVLQDRHSKNYVFVKNSVPYVKDSMPFVKDSLQYVKYRNFGTEIVNSRGTVHMCYTAHVQLFDFNFWHLKRENLLNNCRTLAKIEIRIENIFLIWV